MQSTVTTQLQTQGKVSTGAKMARLNSPLIRLILAFCTLPLLVCQSLDLVVQTRTGKVRGIEAESRDARTFYSFRGIPYAEPPVGDLRFEPPVPKQPWRGVLDASRYGSRCAQIEIFYENFQGQEDCLYLNVFVPKVDMSEGNLPVMFAVHGGYFAAGEAREMGPEYFMDENIIMVTPNYRLSVLGFLNTGDETVRGNMGLKDAALALKWTYENIEFFGGDPNRITVQGVSAAASMGHMMSISNVTRDYVHKLILQSGTALCPWTLHRNPRKQAMDYAESVDCLKEDTKSTVACLKSLDVRTLLDRLKGSSILFAGKNWDFNRIFVPTVENYITEDTFLAKEPLTLLQEGDFKPVPMFTTSNSGEGLIGMSKFLNDRKFQQQLSDRKFWMGFSKQFLGVNLKPEQMKDLDKIVRHYLGKQPINPHSLSTFMSLSDLLSDRSFRVGQHDTIRFHADKSPVYAVYYNKSGPFSIFDMTRAIPANSRFSRNFDVGLLFTRMVVDRVVLRRPPVYYGVNHGDDTMMYTPLGGRLQLAYRYSRDYKFSKSYVKLMADFVTDRKTLFFQGIKVPQVDLANEFQYLIVNDFPNSRIGTVPFKEGYLAWKEFFEKTRS